MDEVEFYQNDPVGLCPVVFHVPGGILVAMRRARPLTDAEWHTIEWQEPDVFSGGLKVRIEHKRSSWGVVANQLVAVDYGGPG